MNHPPKLSFLEIAKNPWRFTRARTEILMDATLRFGNVIKLPHPLVGLYTASHPEDVRKILVEEHHKYRKSFEYEIMSSLVGKGLITSEGEVWERDKRFFQPVFHLRALERFSRHIVATGAATREDWRRRAREENAPDGTLTLDISSEMMKVGLVIIGQRIFSRDVSAHHAEMEEILGFCQQHIVDRMLAIDFTKYFRTPGQRKFEAHLKRLDEIIDVYLEGRDMSGQAKRCEPDPSNDDIDVVAVLKRLKPETGEPYYDRKQLRDHVLTFFLAGHETTATALTWTLYLLAKHPEYQDKLREELLGKFGGREPTFEDLKDLKIIRMVLDESMRLYPPLPFVGREPTEDVVVGGYDIPKGSVIILSQWVTHRRPDLWKNPDTFDPERFSEARKGEIVKYSYYPFGGGPRICIGQQLAMLEIQLVLAQLIQSFRFDLVPGQDVRPLPLISLRPNREVLMEITPL